MSQNFVPSAEEVDRQLEQEFLDETRDKTGQLDVLLGQFRAGQVPAEKTLATVVKEVHTLKVQGRGVHMPILNLVVHRFSDYVGGISSFNDESANDIQIFIDKLSSVLDGEIAGGDEASAALVRELPNKTKAIAQTPTDFGDLTQKIIEILVVVPEKSLSHIIEQEMAACGYRVTNVRNPFNAFEMAVHIRPDLILASQELGDLTGVDLASAFAAMPKTARIPFALLTSYNYGNPALVGLPPRAAIVKKGGAFGESLADALSRFGIT